MKLVTITASKIVLFVILGNGILKNEKASVNRNTSEKRRIFFWQKCRFDCRAFSNKADMTFQSLVLFSPDFYQFFNLFFELAVHGAVTCN